jgi:predicted SAM-dependent methyltransferase
MTAPAPTIPPQVLLRDRLLVVWRARSPIRISLGSGGIVQPGWIATHQSELDLLDPRHWHSVFAPDRSRWRRLWPWGARPLLADAYFAEHVWEHLSAEDGVRALKQLSAFLRPGGHVRLAVPDGLHPDPHYREHVRPGGSGPGADDHKVLYTCAALSEAMRSAGFEPRPLEYWDEEGTFHRTEWNPDDGMVRRSLLHDPRNADGQPHYTSLIVDGIKPR